MNYDESVRALLALGRELAAPRQPALSSAPGARVQKFGLENITALSGALGDPHRAVPCVHIAGTNGKGSTAAMLESILRAAGLHTGLYTSPHLERINERIRINGENISDDDFAAAWTRVHAAIESLLASGQARRSSHVLRMRHGDGVSRVCEMKVELAIYEVGLGGRLDSTNIVVPEVAVITSIDFDHENYLGHSIEEIAAEKAGIVKAGAWVVSSAERPEARAVIARRATEMNARLVEVDTLWRLEDVRVSEGCSRAMASAADSQAKIYLEPALPGRFQLRNALTAAAAARLLAERGVNISDDAIARGIVAARWPGRLERISEHPAVYVDGTHNTAGARELVKFWDENFAGRRIWLVFGAMRDKAVDEIAGLLFPRAEAVILTEPRQPRAISVSLLAEMTAHLARKSLSIRDPGDALERALEMAQPDDAVFATGSLYLVGDLHKYWAARYPEKSSPADATVAPVRSSLTS